MSSYTKHELKDLCDQKGIKYNKSTTKKSLCCSLGLEYHKSPTITVVTFTDRTSGEVLKFPSILNASKHFNINAGLIVYYDDKDLTIGDKVYKVCREIKRKPRMTKTTRRPEQYVPRPGVTLGRPRKNRQVS